jgi:beta-xylosidase/AraC-like DNA-binding protein
LFTFSFVFQPLSSMHSHTDIEFFYVLDGTTVFTLEDKRCRLHKDDFLLVNADKNHAYLSEGDFLGVTLHISYSRLCSLMKQDMVLFWCNTTDGNTEGCEELRRIFRKIIFEEYYGQGKDIIYLNSLFYEFLHILTTDFLLNRENDHYPEETQKFDARKHEIAAFIQTNFDKPIRLEDLAKRTYLSYTYLSKYIKRHFGMGFAAYLSKVRLNYAVSQLLHSDLSVVRIATEAGFASSAALNKAFKQTYNMTPTEYRRQWISQHGPATQNETSQTDTRKRLEQHFDRYFIPETKHVNQLTHAVTLESATKRLLKRNWCRMINIGTAEDLLQSDIQRHLLLLKQELHFEYVRFWDIHSAGMQLGDVETGFNFNRLDQVIDFLLQNGMKPYIELRPKPKLLLRDAFDVIHTDKAQVDESADSIRYFMRRLLIHLMNRYSAEQLESWYFEIWCAEGEQNWTIEDPDLVRSMGERYLERFNVAAAQIRELCPGAKLGGGGLTMRYGGEQVKMLLRAWQKKEQHPDFISLYCYPYTLYTMDRDRNQSRAANLLHNSLHFVRDAMDEEGFTDKELHVSEWNFSISSRNSLNDSCMKGAYLVRDILESLDLADVMGYWVGTDLYSAYADTRSILYGGGGLLSRDGIRKPAFYAFDFMNHLGRYVYRREDCYIITDNGSGNWRIVCHNLKNMSHRYSLMREGEIPISEQNNLFEDVKKRSIHFSLPGKAGGTYLLKRLTVNQRSGSLQDEWVSMSSPEEMSRDEIRYLSRIVTPGMAMKRLDADNGRLSFDITMEPNEITYVHLTCQYS